MLISPFTVRADYPAGSPPGAEPRTASGPVAEHGTTHFVAVDRDGSDASMTSTVESIFGSTLVANGHALNNDLTDLTSSPARNGKPHAHPVEENKHPRTSIEPQMVTGTAATGTPPHASAGA